jgi:hypothetical protein
MLWAGLAGVVLVVSLRMSPRPRRLSRPHHRKHHKRVLTSTSDAPPEARPQPFVDAAIKVGIPAFVLGGLLAVKHGHGELPGNLYPQPQPVAQLAQMAVTTSSSSTLGWLKSL